MTAEDARRSVDALSQLLRDEVAEAMGEPTMSGRTRGPQSSGPHSTSAGRPTTPRAHALREVREANARDSSSGDIGAPAPRWLALGEEHLARALRGSRPVSGQAAALFDGLGGRADRARWMTVRGWVLAALVVGGLAVGAGLATWQNERPSQASALAFRTRDDAPTVARRSGRVIAPADRTEELRFSDGSHLSLAAGSMLRIRETDEHGAMVIVEEGQVESRIQHTGQARWSVFAGAYEVRVVGTRFSTTWDPARQRLAVVLHEGSVQVLGKGIDELVELKPGQRFDSGGPDGKWFVTATLGAQGSAAPGAEVAGAAVLGTPAEATADGPAADVGSEGAGSDVAGSDVAGSDVAGSDGAAVDHAALDRALPRARAEARATPAPSVSWSTLVAHGRFEEVLDEASVAGEAACLRSCSIADLRALADAARYTGRFALAERSLTALRQTPAEAPRAGFLLGSLHEAQGRPAAALEWYGRYLAEAPGGGLVAEARAGRMRALLALGRTEAAKAAARDYLRLHPAGAGATTARQLLHRP